MHKRRGLRKVAVPPSSQPRPDRTRIESNTKELVVERAFPSEGTGQTSTVANARQERFRTLYICIYMSQCIYISQRACFANNFRYTSNAVRNYRSREY